MSKLWCPFIYSDSLYKFGQDFLDMRYNHRIKLNIFYNTEHHIFYNCTEYSEQILYFIVSKFRIVEYKGRESKEV